MVHSLQTILLDQSSPVFPRYVQSDFVGIMEAVIIWEKELPWHVEEESITKSRFFVCVKDLAN